MSAGNDDSNIEKRADVINAAVLDCIANNNVVLLSLVTRLNGTVGTHVQPMESLAAVRAYARRLGPPPAHIRHIAVASDVTLMEGELNGTLGVLLQNGIQYFNAAEGRSAVGASVNPEAYR